MSAAGDAPGLATPAGECSYGDLLARIRAWRARLAGLTPGAIVSVEGDYGPDTIAAFLALLCGGHVAVPLSPDSSAQHEAFLEIGGVEWRIRCSTAAGAPPLLETTGRLADHPLYRDLRGAGHPGLVLFSSGSTGRPKAAVHDVSRLLGKFEVPRQRLRTLVFLLLDHIGGVNTLLYTVANGGTVVLPRPDRPGRSARRSSGTGSSCSPRRRRSSISCCSRASCRGTTSARCGSSRTEPSRCPRARWRVPASGCRASASSRPTV
jgi:acyl-CoA synthetase (AMP-forming)/AMP-acid ligase II